jgi:HAMP domain-containing protein
MGEIMRRTGSRTVKVNKAKLIAKIKENKEAHIIAYAKAVDAYKKEALKQLAELTKKVEAGDMSIRLNLTTPIDNVKSYDKILDIFEWEIDDEVELEQKEFNEYVQDETESARHAMMSNSMYLG